MKSEEDIKLEPESLLETRVVNMENEGAAKTEAVWLQEDAEMVADMKTESPYKDTEMKMEDILSCEQTGSSAVGPEDHMNHNSEESIKIKPVQLKNNITSEDVAWGEKKCLELIDLYEKEAVLWDSQNGDYFNNIQRKDAWNRIARTLLMESLVVQKKMKTLRSSFRREYERTKSSSSTGKGKKDVYTSQWFAFQSMGFLLDKEKPRSGLDTVPTENEEVIHDIYNDVHDTSKESEDGGVTQENSNIIVAGKDVDSANIAQKPEENTNKTNIEVDKQIKIQKYSRKRKYPNMKQSEEEESTTEDSTSSQLDPTTLFGLHIASKLRSYSKVTASHVHRAINNILLDADLGKFEVPLRPYPARSNHSSNDSQSST